MFDVLAAGMGVLTIPPVTGFIYFIEKYFCVVLVKWVLGFPIFLDPIPLPALLELSNPQNNSTMDSNGTLRYP